MNKHKKHLFINDLKEGMMAGEEIVCNNIVLLSEGSKLTNSVIRKLKETYLQNSILIYTEDKDENGDYDENTIIEYSENTIIEKDEIEKITEETEEDEDTRLSIESTFKRIEKSFKIFTRNMEFMFSDIECNRKADLEEVRNFAKNIKEELKCPFVIVKNIVLHGSGKDSIYRHSVNVAALSYLLGKWIGFCEKDLNLLTYSAILHDFGKTKVDRDILYKAEKLSDDEFKLIKNHPVVGYNSVRQIPYLHSSVGFGVLMHHERLDGSGYPLGLKGDKIHAFARIIAIADTFDAINSDRGYKKSKDPFGALETVKRESIDGKFDYVYSKIFIEHIVNYYTGERVQLNTDEICKIIKIDVNDLNRPLLLGKDDFIDLKKRTDLFVKELVV